MRPFACLLLALSIQAGAHAAVKDLDRTYQEWLETVGPLLTKPERKAFLKLEKDYQRDAFIERFWAARDPSPDTVLNEFRERYLQRVEEAIERFENLKDDRSRMFALNGEPSFRKETDCGVYTWPLEIWRYAFSNRANRSVEAIFYQLNAGGPFRLWTPGEGHAVLLMRLSPSMPLPDQRKAFHELLRLHCGELRDDVAVILEAFRRVEIEDAAGALVASSGPASHDPEWIAGFKAFSTDVEEGVAALEADFEVAFLGRYQSRTRVEGTLAIPVAGARAVGEGDEASYNFRLTGEVLRGEELFESFRYRFDVPAARLRSNEIALSFERPLRAGEYRWVIKLDDLNSGAAYREERVIDVPAAEQVAAALAPASESESLPEEASISLGEPGGDVVSGEVRFTATVAGEGIAKVKFELDGKPLLTKTRPPYSVGFNVGSVPKSHTVRATALAADGSELATDEMLLNPGRQSFVARLVEPRDGATASGSVRVRAEVSVPEGKRLEEVEFYVGEERIATLYQEPWVQMVSIESSALGYLRIVARLEDGSETEDLVVVNSPPFSANVEVRLIELYAAVLDTEGRAVIDLGRDDFTILESGARQDLVRFEFLDELPLFAGLLIDTSASMAENFDAVHDIGRSFLDQMLRPSDRAAVITFSEQPRLAAPFTNDMAALSSALAGLRAERGTALWDSLVFAIDYFKGIKGQRALIVLSDGEDRRSTQSFAEALQFAQNTGVTIYTVALANQIKREGKGRLNRLAEQTGGRSYVLDSIAALGEAYEQIQIDLRSRYLLTYQSDATADGEFRPIEVQVADRGHEVRTLRGYFP